MMLINALLTHVSDERWDEFIGELERLNVRKAVVVSFSLLPNNCAGAFAETTFHQRLMNIPDIEDVTSGILDFQANIVRVTYRKKTTGVDPGADASHALALKVIWEKSRMDEEVDEEGHIFKWRKLGFENENMSYEFRDVGVLGLECLVRLLVVAIASSI